MASTPSGGKRQRTSTGPSVADPTTWRGRSAVALRNENVEIIVTSGGGHIVSFRLLHGANTTNALWEPPWPTMDPALRRLASSAGIASNLEGELLAGIGGANLCCDVFGAQSKGEMAAGLAFHGEAGLSTWEVESWSNGSLVLSTDLRKTQLRIRRTFRLSGHVVIIHEEMTNLCSFERALGRCQHVTLGKEFLVGDGDVLARPVACRFEAGCDKGHTWPEDMDPTGALKSQWEPNVAFDYPNIPLRAKPGSDHAHEQAAPPASEADWGQFPRWGWKNSDLCTLRVTPTNEHGWFSARRRRGDKTEDAMTFACAWERKAFPWLMTWEENCARQEAPWNGRTLCRGLEISSYAFATGRRENVERGKLLDTPTFEWLDADETKATTWYMSLQGGTPSGTGAALCGLF